MYTGKKILVAVDCLIFGYDTIDQELKVLLFKRKVDPFSGRWSLIGDFVDEEENVTDAALRVLKQHTGLVDVFLEQLHTFGDVSRDPGARVISVSMRVWIKLDNLRVELAEGFGAKWFAPNEVPEMILDHANMIQKGYEKIRRTASTTAIALSCWKKNSPYPTC